MISKSPDDRKFKWSLSRKGLAFITATLLVQLIFFAWLAHLLQQSEFIAEKESHSKVVIGQANWLAALLSMNAISGVGYAISADPDCSDLYRWSKERVPKVLKELTSNLSEKHDQVQLDQIESAQTVWSKITKIMDGYLQLKSASDPQILAKLRQDEADLKPLWQQLIKARSQSLLEERTRVDTSLESPMGIRNLQKGILEGGVAISIFAALIAFYLFSKRITTRIDFLSDNAKRLARGEKLSPSIPGSDEIADLDKTFHSMAEELNAAKLKLEASERRMVTLIENMPVGLLTVERNGLIEFANPICKSMFVETNLTGVPLKNLLPLKPEQLQKLLEQPGTEQPIETTVTKNYAQPIIVELTTKSVSMAEGERVLIMLQDVTQRHELERLKQEFLSMVSHDLRTPLSSIDLFLHLVKKVALDVLPAPVKSNLMIAERSTKRLLNLVNDLLDIEQLQTGKMNLNLRRCGFGDVIEQSIAAVKSVAEQRQITIDSESTKIELHADEDRLVQVMVNLLSNAVKFSSDGAEVFVAAKSDGEWIECRVTDHGRGIPEQHIETIFEKYKQVEKSDARRGFGTGLGLPICKAIIEQHGGSIGVESLLGQGSTFWFRLPLNSTS